MTIEKKSSQTLNGVLLRPLTVGAKAVILHRGKVTITSRVVDIYSYTADEARFATEDTRYRLLTGPSRQPAVSLFAMPMAA